MLLFDERFKLWIIELDVVIICKWREVGLILLLGVSNVSIIVFDFFEDWNGCWEYLL